MSAKLLHKYHFMLLNDLMVYDNLNALTNFWGLLFAWILFMIPHLAHLDLAIIGQYPFTDR